MFASTKCSIALLALIFANTSTYGSRYIVDVVEIKWHTNTPDAVGINLRPVQPTRGVFGLSGLVDIKEDINTDRAKGEVKILYSSNDISYQLTPFRMPRTSITNLLNNPSTRKVQKVMQECCTGAGTAISDPFVSPLKKRVIECENCLSPTDVIPSAMRPGFYQVVVLVEDHPKLHLNVTFLFKLENDI